MPRKMIWGSRREMYTGLKTIFFNAYDLMLEDSVGSLIAMEVESNGAEEAYPWLGGLSQMKEFISERQIETLSAFDFTIKNKEWENTIGIKRSELDDDKFGAMKIRIAGLSETAVLHREKMIVGLLITGLGSTSASLCFDGQSFFDTDHPGAIQNDDGTITATTQSNRTTAAFTETALKAGVTAMSLFTDDKGNILGLRPNILLVGPQLEFVAGEILKRGTTADANARPNLLSSVLTLKVSPFVTPITAGKYPWFLLCTSRSVKPLIFQTRVPIEFTALDKNDDEGVFIRNQYLYGVYARYNAGFGLWQMAYGSDGTA